MGKFKLFVEKYLEIQISSYQNDEGHPTSTVMKHRNKDGGKWEYDADLDSGEQEHAKDIPSKVKDLLKKFNHNV